MSLGTSPESKTRNADTASTGRGFLYNRNLVESWIADPVGTTKSDKTPTTESGPLDPTKPVRQPIALLNPATEMRSIREIKVQEWEGRVLEVSDDAFTAALLDISAEESIETEEATLPISDLTDEDRKLLAPGAIFRWIIGYHFGGGVKDRFGRLVFRRLPVWTPDEIRAADEKAKRLASSIRWDEDSGATIAESD